MSVSLISKRKLKFEKGPLVRSLFTNGAVSLFHHHQDSSSSNIKLYFLVGSQDEKKGEYGITHLLEHMLFKEKKESSLLVDMEKKGALINAYTTKEYVCFELDCLASKQNLFFEDFLSLFLNPYFDKKEFLKERKVVIQELREDLDDHEAMADDYLSEKTLPSDIGHPIGGKISDIKKIGFDQMVKFHKKYFNPSRLILCVCSGYQQNQTLNKIFESQMAKFYSSKKMKPKRMKAKDKFYYPEVIKSFKHKKMSSSLVMLNYPGPALDSRYYYELMILDEILAEGLTSVLYLALREKKGLVYSIGSSIESYEQAGCYRLFFQTSKSKSREVLETVKEIMDSLLNNAPSEVQIEEIKERMIDHMTMSYDDIETRNEHLAIREMYGKDNFSLEIEKKKLLEVNKKTLVVMLTKLLKNNPSELIWESKSGKS